jgi:hypothetical protein
LERRLECTNACQSVSRAVAHATASDAVEKAGITIKGLQHLVAQLCRPRCQPARLLTRVWNGDIVVGGDVNQLTEIVRTREIDIGEYKGDLQSLLDGLLGVDPTTSSRSRSNSAYSSCSGVGAGNDSALP